MKKVEKDIHINAPVDKVFALWSDFTRFPNIMHNIKEVRKIADDKYHWVAQIGGIKVEWDAQVTLMERDKAIGWKSTSGDQNSGEVRFVPMNGGTHLYVTIVYDPPAGILGEIADTLTHRVPSDLEEDLKNFKTTVESNYAHS